MTKTTPPPEIARLQALAPGSTWRHDPRLELQSIDVKSSIALQVRDKPIDQPTVARYAEALEAGDVFPPIVVREITGPRGTKRLSLGGLHRIQAHHAAGRSTIDAWVVTVDDDLVALEVAYHDNAHHGLSPTSSERIGHALRLMAAGRTQTQAARIVGITAPTIASHRSRSAVAERAHRLGVATDLDRIASSSRAALVSIKDDRLFTTVVETVAKERIPNAAIGPLVGNLNAQPTLAAQRKVLADHVRHNRATINASRGRGNPSRAPRMMAATAMSTLSALTPAAVVDDCRTAFDRQQLAKAAMAAARQLKTIHDLANRTPR